MAIRTGMTALVARLRLMTETGVADYSVNGTAYWTDDQLQDMLDQHVDIVRLQVLQPEPEYSAGATIWKDYPTGCGALEDEASGIPYWSLTDSSGVEVTGTLYALEQATGIIRFTTDQAGVIYFLTGRNYRMMSCAAAIWRIKMGHVATAYDFTTEGQSFSRSQMFDHCVAMAEQFSRQGGFSTAQMYRSDLW